jgi:hypothetical protein
MSEQSEHSYLGNVLAPEFPAEYDWLNTYCPISIKSFQGKILLIFFWSVSDIHARNLLPVLQRIVDKYSDEVAIMGVHISKYTAEKDTLSLRHAVLRQGIEFPVINDPDGLVAESFLISRFPTTLIIDPLGKTIGSQENLFTFDYLDTMLKEMVREFSGRNLLSQKKLRFHRELIGSGAPLYYPSAVLADEETESLYISDSGHNRILVTSLTGQFRRVIGTGEAGMNDGPAQYATFHHPQGLSIQGSLLFVADTYNHAIRVIDLDNNEVHTVAGRGAPVIGQNKGGEAITTFLNSPIGLVVFGDAVYITMPGLHQIWVLNLQNGLIYPYAGTGYRGTNDGELLESRMNHPSAICTHAGNIYFTDVIEGAIREITPHTKVQRIVGGSFEYGDRDGKGGGAFLQYPKGLCSYGGYLIFSDTYNNKIKTVHPITRECKTLFGDGVAGYRDGASHHVRFHHPSGLSNYREQLFVADTNNHIIRVINLQTGDTQSLLFKDNLPPPPIFQLDALPNSLSQYGSEGSAFVGLLPSGSAV